MNKHNWENSNKNQATLAEKSDDQSFLNECRDFALQLAGIAGDHSLAAYEMNKNMPASELKRKADNSIVTKTDKDIENLLRSEIQNRYPKHAIVGEEFSTTQGSDYVWILDPIDGTRSFVAGVPLYTILIGFYSVYTARIEFGIVYAPQTKELCCAMQGKSMRYYGQFDKASLQVDYKHTKVSDTTQLKLARLISYDWGACLRHSENILSLLKKAEITRTWGDGYGYLLLATGRVDAVIDPRMHVWDIAALLPIISAAGGSLCDWSGNPIAISKVIADAANDSVVDVIAAATPELRDQILLSLN